MAIPISEKGKGCDKDDHKDIFTLQKLIVYGTNWVITKAS